MIGLRHPQTNCLISGLPSKNKQNFLAECQQVDLAFGDILCEPNEPIRHVHFPVDSIISLVNPIDGHSSLVVALVGNEGMHGISLPLGLDTSQLRALVQGKGHALLMKAASYRRMFRQMPVLQRIHNRYIYVRMRQLAQMATCIRFHVVEGRLASSLLMIQDRAYSDVLHITHDSLSLMLGVRRVGITKAAGSLQKSKLIDYSRGVISILDRPGLEAASCGCYRTDKATYDRIMR